MVGPSQGNTKGCLCPDKQNKLELDIEEQTAVIKPAMTFNSKPSEYM